MTAPPASTRLPGQMCRRCAPIVAAATLLLVFSQASRAELMIETLVDEPAMGESSYKPPPPPERDNPPVPRTWCPLPHNALFGSGGAAGSSSPSSSSPSSNGLSAAMPSTGEVESGSRWQRVSETGRPRLAAGAPDSIFHPPRICG